MKKPSIVFTKHTPFIAVDVDQIIDTNGKKVGSSSVVVLCRCGKSKHSPYCDDSHGVQGLNEVKQEDRSPDRVKDYRGEDIIVHFNLGVCCHDGHCVEALPEVFDIHQRPWIQPDKGKTGEIIGVIENCPAGALSYTIGGRLHQNLDNEAAIIIEENGPLKVRGYVELKDDQNTIPACKEHYTLCRCGKSKNKPFCDGAHHKNE